MYLQSSEYPVSIDDLAKGRATLYFAPQQQIGALGQTATPSPTLCPPCAYHHEGRCKWCPEDKTEASEIPECAGCDGRTPPPEPWYTKSELVVPIVTAVVVTVLGTVVSAILLRRLGQE